MVRVSGRELFVVYLLVRALPSLRFQVSNQMVSPILFAYTGKRLHERQTQCKTNRTSATSSKTNSLAKGAASHGSPSNSAFRGRMPTRSLTASGSTPICSSKSAICWITTSSNAIRITETREKKNKTSCCPFIKECYFLKNSAIK